MQHDQDEAASTPDQPASPKSPSATAPPVDKERMAEGAHPAVDPVQAWVEASKHAGGKVSPERVALVQELVRSLKQNGIWDRLDRLWIFAAENEAQAMVDLVAGQKAIVVNGPKFVAGKGYVFNGASQYIDTNFAGSDPGARYSLDSASFGGYLFGEADNSGGVEFGNDFGAYSMLVTRFGRWRRFQVNSRTDTSPRIPAGHYRTGHFHCQRVSATRTELYRDGVLEGHTTDHSAAVPRMSFYVGGGRSRSGPSGHYSSASISTAHIGASLSATQIARFDQAIHAFVDAAAVRAHTPQVRSTKAKKIAVCLSGALGAFNTCAPSIRAFFGGADYFGTFWSADRGKIFQSVDPQAYLPFRALDFPDQPKALDVASPKLRIPNTSIAPMLRGMQMSFQFFHRNIPDSAEYDLVFRCRPDLLLRGQVTDFVDLMEENKVYLPNHSHDGGYCEQFAGGPPRLMETLFSTFEAISIYDKEPTELRVGQLLKYWLDRHGVETVELPFDFKIFRPEFAGMRYEDIPRSPAE